MFIQNNDKAAFSTPFSRTTGFNPINRKNFCFLAKFSFFRKFLQIFHVVLPLQISVSNSKKSVPVSFTKKSAQKIVLFYSKNLRFQNFLAFLQK